MPDNYKYQIFLHRFTIIYLWGVFAEGVNSYLHMHFPFNPIDVNVCIILIRIRKQLIRINFSVLLSQHSNELFAHIQRMSITFLTDHRPAFQQDTSESIQTQNVKC